MYLFQESTKLKNGDWRIQRADSAGFFVRAGSDCIPVIDNLDYTIQRFKKPLMDGAEPALTTALDSVFDNASFSFPAKQAIGQAMFTRLSRGIRKDLFLTYDFIIVFTNREHDNMVKLRLALGKQDRSLLRMGKGRVIHLGIYLSTDGYPREIMVPPRNPDGSDNRGNWNWKTSELKMGLKGFLTSEMDWAEL